MSNSILEKGVAKKYEETLLELSQKENIETSSIGFGYCLNEKAKGLEYQSTKQMKGSPMSVPVDHYGHCIFVNTHQTLILKSLIHYLQYSNRSRVMVMGEKGKTTLLQHFSLENRKDNRQSSLICSIYTPSALL